MRPCLTAGLLSLLKSSWRIMRMAELLTWMGARIEVDLRASRLEWVAADAIGVLGEEDNV